VAVRREGQEVNLAPDSPMRERLLWLRVIAQAQQDAAGKAEVEPHLQYLAQRWLTKMTRSFLTVCSLAGMPETQAHYLQEQERKRWLKS
jgi:hypothetical protein